MNISSSVQIFRTLSADFCTFFTLLCIKHRVLWEKTSLFCFREKATARVALVLTNRPSAYVLQRAASLDVPALCFSKDEWADGRPVLQALQAHAIDFKFGGKGMYGDRVHQAVLAAGETESGITIHYTNEHYDEGAVIRQYACPVLPDDTPDTLAARVHTLEYAHYPEVIEALVQALP